MNWPLAKLGDLCEIVSGSTPDTSKKENWDGDVLWATPSDLSKNSSKIISNTSCKITSIGLSNCSARVLPKNSVLFSSRAPIGLVAINSQSMATNQGFKSFVPNASLLDSSYLYYWLRTNKSFLNGLGVGATFKEVSKSIISKVQIPLPPLAEQQRIARILDTADRLMQLRESAIAKLDQLAQSVFVEMFESCTNYESIRSVVLKKKTSVPKESQHVWSLSLDQIESDTGNLQNKEIVEFKKLGTSTYYFEPPAILYSKLRPYLNKVVMPTDCGYATTELVPLYCNEQKVLPIYLLAVLRSKKFVEFANTNSGGAKMPRVIMDKFWDYQFALPSIDEQQKYANFFISIVNQKRHCLHLYKLNQALFTSLQHQSFAVN